MELDLNELSLVGVTPVALDDDLEVAGVDGGHGGLRGEELPTSLLGLTLIVGPISPGTGDRLGGVVDGDEARRGGTVVGVDANVVGEHHGLGVEGNPVVETVASGAESGGAVGGEGSLVGAGAGASSGTSVATTTSLVLIVGVVGVLAQGDGLAVLVAVEASGALRKSGVGPLKLAGKRSVENGEGVARGEGNGTVRAHIRSPTPLDGLLRYAAPFLTLLRARKPGERARIVALDATIAEEIGGAASH